MESSLKEVAKNIRKDIVSMHQRGTNVGSAMSIVDILVVLYFDVMNIKSADDPQRDRFILSKGHAVSALYSTLANKRFFSHSLLKEYLTDASVLYGHPVRRSIAGIEVSTGSLGHGLPIAVGMALAAKNDNQEFKTYVLMGDGECQEGSVWEGAMIAARLKLNNIVAVIDANNLQGYDRVEKIQPVSTFKSKWEAFGWNVLEVDGHNIDQLKKAFKELPNDNDKPSVVIAHTIKGKGVAEMEGKLGWHYYSVPKDKVELFINEIENRQ